MPVSSVLTLSNPALPFVAEYPGTLGGTHRKSVLEDSDGNLWLFKPQSIKQSRVDRAASIIAQSVGINTPIVDHLTFSMGGYSREGSIQPYLPVAAGELDRDMSTLTNEERVELQRHHVVDRLLGNPDTHRGQFVILSDGTIVAVDKAQALRFFPHDSLSWKNRFRMLNTRQSAYYYLFEGAYNQRYALNPDEAINFGALISINVPASWLKGVWEPVIKDWPLHRLLNFGAHLTPSEAIDEALHECVNRCLNLSSDFDNLYYHDSSGLW